MNSENHSGVPDEYQTMSIDMRKVLPPDEFDKLQMPSRKERAGASKENAEVQIRQLERQGREPKAEQARRAERERQELNAGLIYKLANVVRQQSAEAAKVFVQHALNNTDIGSADDLKRALDQKFGLYQEETIDSNLDDLKPLTLDVPISVGDKQYSITVQLIDLVSNPALNFQVTEKKRSPREPETFKRTRPQSVEAVAPQGSGVGGFLKRLFGRK